MTLEELNSLPREKAEAELLRCCGSSAWAAKMASSRPFRDEDALFSRADQLWSGLGRKDYLEAFTHHPRIGDVSKLRQRFAATAGWSSEEQKGVGGASEETLQALAKGNLEYEEKFGFIFLVCATGRSADEMLALLRARMPNPSDRELQIAAGEQAKITRIRLEKLLRSS